MLTLQVEWCSTGLGEKGEGSGAAAAAAAAATSAAAAAASGIPSTTLLAAPLPKLLKPSHGPQAYAARAPELYTKPVGCSITRSARELARLDIFRSQWAEEEGRWRLEEELAASFPA